MANTATGGSDSGKYWFRPGRSTKMKYWLKIFVAFYPVMLVTCQVIVNLIAVIHYPTYVKHGFYFGLFFGTNLSFSIVFIAMCHLFKFCRISIYCAYAELAFGIAYMVIKQDNVYNVTLQIIIGAMALIFTFGQYIRKFPLCRLSLVTGFIWSVISKCSCEKGLEKWDQDLRRKISNHVPTRSRL
jgi:hypothetical protein